MTSALQREFNAYVGLDDIGTHILRKTFGYHFYKQRTLLCCRRYLITQTNGQPCDTSESIKAP